MTDALRWLVGAVAVAAILLSATTFTVREGEAGLHTRFGRAVAVQDDAGLYFKAPWPIDRVVALDTRAQILESRSTELLTQDKKNLVLVTASRWRVADPLAFYRSLGSVDDAERKLDGLVTNAVIGVLGRHPLSALVSTDPATLAAEAIEAEILAAVSGPAAEGYGITVEDVSFVRLSLPENNVGHVFDQMRAERQQFAARYRAEGEREAARIRSETDVEAARLRAEASEAAARIRGNAEAEAARVYAEAHGRNPELFRFLRSLESLDTMIGDDTTLLLRTDAAPFDVLESRP
ncbi:MAG: membrane protease subunit HflC [Myxococcota bacterium]